MPTFLERVSSGWNAFRNKDPVRDIEEDAFLTSEYSPGSVSVLSSSSYPDRRRYLFGKDQTIVGAILNRLATDASLADMKHVRLDENDNFVDEVNSGLNYCLTQEANIDQTGRAFIQDLVQSVLEVGYAAVVPVDTTVDPNITGGYDIRTMRVGKINQWHPRHVRVDTYNDRTGLREELVLRKENIAIVENPFFSVMNEPNGVLNRLTRKLALLDVIDNQSGSGKLDLIIQLPYVVKSETRQKQAEQRIKLIEDQLTDSKYGIAYTDGTERITQLNRAVENNLMGQIQYLTDMLYSQLGITADILNGTASESAMINYYKRTIDVILWAVASEFERKFLTKTARSQRQAVRFYRSPFSLTPSSDIAEIADKFTRNEVLSPNEVRGVVGFKPSPDESANELRNRNLNQNGEVFSEPATVDQEW